MQDHTRQIAYLYAYEYGEKSRCAGFVKARTDKTRCRLDIHLRPGRFPDELSGKIYIYFHQQNRNIGIYLGDLTKEHDTLTWQGFVDTENILEKEIRLADTSGIWIICSENRVYIAQWDDTPADTRQFILYPRGGARCIRCPWLGRCERSMEDASDRRGTIYEGSHPPGP